MWTRRRLAFVLGGPQEGSLGVLPDQLSRSEAGSQSRRPRTRRLGLGFPPPALTTPSLPSGEALSSGRRRGSTYPQRHPSSTW